MVIVNYTIATLFICIAVITDYMEYKIKNISVLMFSAIGVLVNAVMSGMDGIFDSFCGLLIPLLLFPLFMLKMLGAGDIKALCAIGSIVGLKTSIYTVLFSFIAGGAIALMYMILRKNAWYRMKQFGKYVSLCFLTQTLQPYGEFTDEKSGFRFILGISGGFLLAILWINYGNG